MTTEKTGDIFKVIPLIAKEVGVIEKDRSSKKPDGTIQYQFRGIDDVYNALHDILSKHGVFTIPEVLDIKREERQSKTGSTLIWTVLTIKYTIYASDGSDLSAIVMGEAMDTGDKSCGKAMSYAHKIFLLQILAIPTSEPKDTENETHEIGGKPIVKATPIPSKPAPQSTLPANTVRVGIAQITPKQLKNTAGQPFTKYIISADNKLEYSTTNKSIHTLAETALGNGLVVDIQYESNKYGNTIKSLNVPDAPKTDEEMKEDLTDMFP